MAESRPVSVTLVVLLVLTAGCAGIIPADTDAQDAAPTSTSDQPSANGTVEVHFINVGQSVSTLVVGSTGETMLVDTGHYNDDGEYVLQYLQRHDIDRLDHLVVSHNDADHIGGNAAVIDYFETEGEGVGAVYDPGIAASTQTYREYLDAVEEHDVTLYETREGDTIQFEGSAVQVLGPPDPYLEDEARNENSIVLKLTHGETSFLLTGDAEDDQERYLVDEYGDQLQSTVLKAGHHGSSSSTGERFLDAVEPNAVVISSAYDSQYGHPHDEVLRRLAERAISTYWTATHGDVVLVSDGTAISVRTQQAAPTEPLSLRSGEPIRPGTGSAVTERTRLGDEPVQEPATTVATDGGATATSTGAQLAISEIRYDAAGDDRENLNDEYVVFTNTGETALDLSGLTVEDEAGHTFTVPTGFTLEAGASVTLHTGSGTDSQTDLYWESGSPIWNNDGDTVIVRNSNGETVLVESYDD